MTEEKVIYEGKSAVSMLSDSLFRSIFRLLTFGKMRPRYRITNQRVSIIKGLFSREEHELDFIKVKDISLRKQRLGERMSNIGTLYIVATDVSTPTLELRLKQPREWRDRLRSLIQEAKKEAGVQYREEL